MIAKNISLNNLKTINPINLKFYLLLNKTLKKILNHLYDANTPLLPISLILCLTFLMSSCACLSATELLILRHIFLNPTMFLGFWSLLLYICLHKAQNFSIGRA